jgi:hypothetical protein
MVALDLWEHEGYRKNVKLYYLTSAIGSEFN